MRTWTTTHECPNDEHIVTLEYEAGLSPDEFYLIEEDAYCEQGCQITGKTLDKWYEEDRVAYREYLYESLTYYQDEGGNG